MHAELLKVEQQKLEAAPRPQTNADQLAIRPCLRLVFGGIQDSAEAQGPANVWGLGFKFRA